MLCLRSGGNSNRGLTNSNRENNSDVLIWNNLAHSAADLLELCIQELGHVENAFDWGNWWVSLGAEENLYEKIYHVYNDTHFSSLGFRAMARVFGLLLEQIRSIYYRLYFVLEILLLECCFKWLCERYRYALFIEKFQQSKLATNHLFKYEEKHMLNSLFHYIWHDGGVYQRFKFDFLDQLPDIYSKRLWTDFLLSE